MMITHLTKQEQATILVRIKECAKEIWRIKARLPKFSFVGARELILLRELDLAEGKLQRLQDELYGKSKVSSDLVSKSPLTEQKQASIAKKIGECVKEVWVLRSKIVDTDITDQLATELRGDLRAKKAELQELYAELAVRPDVAPYPKREKSDPTLKVSLRATVNRKHATRFLLEYPGKWHAYAKDAKETVKSLTEFGIAETGAFNQFRLKDEFKAKCFLTTEG